ncbi:MAG: uroporphyrinogen-III synthase [Methanolinea sp.]|nr:uroporphyrinogen-III synthase [Methanolinea sp.]
MKIAITRLKEKETDDAVRCGDAGHECITVSPLKAEIFQDRIAEFVEAVDANRFDCLFFTSALPARLIAPRISRWPRVVAIGPQTRRELARYGIDAEVLPGFYSRDFVPYLGSWIRGRQIGIPRADVPNPGLLDAIREAGGEATEVRVYSLTATEKPLPLEGVDAILFTSAMSYKKAIWENRPGLLLMAIGEVTADVMRKGNCPPTVVGDGSLEGTLSSLARYLLERRGDPGGGEL